MKRKTLYALGLSAVLGFSTLSGCGCGAVQTPESTQQETSTVEEESTSAIETVAQEETPSATETEAVETESEIANDVTVTEETTSEINELDGTLYTTTDVALREKNTVASEKLATVPAGTAVHVTGITEDEQWYQISDYEDIEVGYISGAYLSSEKPSPKVEESAPAESQAPAETTPAPEAPATEAPVETPSTPSGGSTATAPNPGAQEVYDSVNSGQSNFDPNTPAPGATPDNINGDMFGNVIEGGFTDYQGNSDVLGSLHAAD